MSSTGGERPAGGPASGLPAGASLVELTVAMGLICMCSAMTVPLLAGAAEAGRAREAAVYLASQLRSARMQAVAGNRTAAVVFDTNGSRWLVRRCVDGNRNGLRRADINSGKDVCAPAVDVSELFANVRLDVPTGLPDPDGGSRTNGAVRFGSSDIASFAPVGTASAGTVYVRSQAGAQYAIRVAGATGRTRTLQFDAGSQSWREI